MLINCKECGRQVSSTAEFCPHCGNTKFLEQHLSAVRQYKKQREEDRVAYEEQARSEGFKNADAKREAEYKEIERKEKIRWMFEDLPHIIVGASLIIGVILLCLWFAYIVIFV